MTMTLDKSALFAAMEAFWEAEGGNERGVEAAISAYLHGHAQARRIGRGNRPVAWIRSRA
ncbi:hypothetical protein N183_22225 [Sinorhizobium sp. Sb3]|uniref:hypothetical protein n=1 Tax=Sinorhizobium sp. Sb3 TaxID=1358417 RepID=UPI0007287826|nr:hypothetical protein [Sinorhizobium sp. Sb3]KSV75056.1 hypothetical protein N183_22225 [Sinorhizobium sp. Sb3]